jgi:hypothetical protein
LQLYHRKSNDILSHCLAVVITNSILWTRVNSFYEFVPLTHGGEYRKDIGEFAHLLIKIQWCYLLQNTETWEEIA